MFKSLNQLSYDKSDEQEWKVKERLEQKWL